MQRVLIIEDDKDIAELISIHLDKLEYEVKHARNGMEGFDVAMEGPFDLIILDVMLPGIDGLEVCRRLRAKENFVPIMMLTSKSEEIDKVLGLETGADDYLTKPFGIREFQARVKAILRRETMHAQSIGKNAVGTLHLSDLIIDNEKHKVTVRGERVELTPKEYDLLLLLASHPGKVFGREDLLNLIWGYEFPGYERTVNSHINRLRTKIEKEFAKPQYILTAWGIGYKFNDEIF
jgi:two-component system alkaline phosphatase synthesis response regulator PhoP